MAKAGLAQLKSGLQKAGIGPENFDLQRDERGAFGWRSPYRGLEALEPEDAAVFFGRERRPRPRYGRVAGTRGEHRHAGA